MAREISLKVFIDAVTDQAVGNIRKFTGAIGEMSRFASGVFLGNVLTQAAQGAAMMAMEGLNAVASYERLAFSLESMMASEVRAQNTNLSFADSLSVAKDMARDTLQWLEKLSLQSPFESTAVQGVFQMQMRLGASSDEAKKLTEDLLNLAAANGLNTESLSGAGYALAQIRASDKLYIQDLRQLINAGIDVNGVLARMGLDLSDVGDQTISTADFMRAFHEQALDAGDAVERMSDTWPGLLGALSDFKTIGLRELFGGAMEGLKPLVQMLTDWLMGPGRDKITEWGQALGDFAGHVSDLVLSLDRGGLFGQGFRDALGQISPKAQEVWDTIKPFIADGLHWLRDNGELVKGALTGIAIALGGLVIAGSIAGLISMITNPLTIIIALAGLLGAAWSQNWLGIRDRVAEFWALAQPIFAQVVSWLQANIPVAIQFVTEAFNSLATFVPQVISAVSQAWQAFWTWVAPWTNGMLGVIKGIWQAFSALFKGDFYAFGQALRQIWDNLWQMVTFILRNNWQVLVNLVQGLWDKVTGFFKDGVDKAKRAITEEGWVNVGKNIIDGIISGIKNFASKLYDAIKKVAKAAYDTFRGFFGIESPSTLMRDQVGGMIMRGWAEGIDRGLPQVRSAVEHASNVVNTSVVNNYYLSVQSMRSVENIVQDFQLMRARA